jgi:hypothetical protein
MSSGDWQALAEERLKISARSFHRRRLQLYEDRRVNKSPLTGNYRRTE